MAYVHIIWTYVSSITFHTFSYTGAYFVLAFLCRVLCQPSLGRLVVAQEAAKTGFGENREECPMCRGEAAMTCLLSGAYTTTNISTFCFLTHFP